MKEYIIYIRRWANHIRDQFRMERNNLFEIIPGFLLRALLPEHDGNY